MSEGDPRHLTKAASGDVAHDSMAPLAFWLGFPIVLGLFSGWNQIGMVAPYLTLAWSIIYWLLLSAIMWSGLGLGTILVGRTMPIFPRSTTMIVGAVIGVILTQPIHASFQALFLPLTTNPAAIHPLPSIPITRADWALLLSSNAMLMMFWIGGTLFFARFLGFVPFARTPLSIGKQAPLKTVQAPLVASRLSRLRFGDVDVMQAEDHYLRLSGTKGDELILYRFADAVTELAPLGWTRIHRSFCVRDGAVAGREARGRTLELMMQSGQRVPVSERYRAVVDLLF